MRGEIRAWKNARMKAGAGMENSRNGEGAFSA